MNDSNVAGKIFGAVIAIAVIVFLLIFVPKILEVNESGHITVLQDFVDGEMHAVTSEGPFMQAFGTVHDYKKSDTFFFKKEGEGKAVHQGTAIQVRFNDGATALISGSVRFELPADQDRIVELHRMFRSYETLVESGIQQLVREAVILTAALMSAEESYTTKRSFFAEAADNQVTNGVYLTEQAEEEITEMRVGEGEARTKRLVVRIRYSDAGEPERRENPIAKYGITLTQFVITEIDYEPVVDERIAKKQEALMATVTARADAERAIQERITSEEQGKKNVAVAEYSALVTKKTAVIASEQEKEVAETQAKKELEVARLGAETAEQYKKKVLTHAEADAEAARKRIVADGALQIKLETWLRAQQAWADAMARSAHPLVPSVVFGGNNTGSGSQNGALQLLEIMAAKAAQDLSVDVSPGKRAMP